MLTSLLWAAGGTGFTFALTALGAATVFFFRRRTPMGANALFFGFAAGVMIAASVWSLLIPAVEQAQADGLSGWKQAAGGFLLGIFFLIEMDKLVLRLRRGTPGCSRRSFLLMTAVTLHNIPEGMAVGLSFALAGLNTGDPLALASAVALSVGIGIQNFPEGAAISLPLRQEGMPALPAFAYGALSGAVEPLFGIACVLIAGIITPLMPWLLSFAAGAMMYVVVEELLPEATAARETSRAGVLGTMAGFLLMMILDVALG